ncbi:MAG: SLATT domain-containing protein [Xenococcaceae cyanobacterium]
MSHNNIDRDNREQSLALETAWQRYAQLKTNASAAFRQYLSLRGWAIALVVVVTLLAILTSSTDSALMASNVGEALTACLILAPIVGLVIFAFTNKLQQGQYWLLLGTGAEEIRKEIYLYRTLLQGQAKRHQWLNERVTTIQSQVLERVGGNLVLKPYTGKIPPDYFPEHENSDPGYTDLLADDYLRYRLEAQLKWHSQEAARLYTTRTNLRIGIFALGGLSAFLPALGFSLNIWVAFTISVAVALTVWLEVSRLDDLVNNYNQLILELKIIRDHWQSLSPEERTGNEFFQLVLATEKVLWSQHNQNITQMRQAVTELHGTASDLLTQVINSPAPGTFDQALLPEKTDAREILTAEAEILLEEGAILEEVQIEKPEPKKPVTKGLPHAFVVMPFGQKKGPDGRWIDFDSIYHNLIKPALEEAGFKSFRADEESVSGDILTDMLQELLLADLVLADLSIDNANVFYELGVRHALRKRGLIHIQCGRAYMPYDIFNVRTLPYHCDEYGQPDPQNLEKDKQAIVKMARATWESDRNRIHSPIFNLLDGLPEPNRKLLCTPLATGYWQEYKKWQERVTIAQRQKQIGDVLLLTEEVRNPLIKCEALADAGKALKNLGNYALALKEYQEGLKLDPENSVFRREEAFHLSRLKQYDEAIVKLEWLLRDEPTNIQAISYLARIYKGIWKDEWAGITDEQERLKEAYESAHLLKKAIETYLQGYRLDHNHYYSGINAFTLSAVLDHLAHQVGTGDDPEEEAIRQQLPSLKGAVQFCLESSVKKDANNFWAFLSLGDLAVCAAQDPKQVTRAYKKALTLVWNNKFALQSTLAQLELLNLLSFRSEYVKAGIDVLQAELDRVENQEKAVASQIDREPLQVFLFSGHMIDNPSRPQPRFPAAMESEARQRIEQILDKLKADSKDLAIAPGAACGGDILFLEACLQRNMKVEVFLPFHPAEFIKESVSFAGNDWVERFYKIQNHPNVTIHFQPERLGKVPEGDNPYERNNRWALYSTLMYGIERVRLVVLWNGKGGDALGGTSDMVQQVRQLGGIVQHLDTTKFDYWKIPNPCPSNTH